PKDSERPRSVPLWKALIIDRISDKERGAPPSAALSTAGCGSTTRLRLRRGNPLSVSDRTPPTSKDASGPCSSVEDLGLTAGGEGTPTSCCASKEDSRVAVLAPEPFLSSRIVRYCAPAMASGPVRPWTVSTASAGDRK